MQKLKILNIGWANSIHVEKFMRWFAEKGHEVSIVTNVTNKIDGVKIYSIEKKSDFRPRRERYKDLSFNVSWDWLRDLNAIVRLKRVVREISPDIIHSHSLWYPGYLGIYLNFHPFVITLLNGDVLWTKEDIGMNVNFFTKLRTYIGLRKADFITGESEELVNACIRRGANKDKVQVMRRGVDLKLFNCNENKIGIRRTLGLPENSKIVLSPRNTASFYNLNKIVMAIPKVVKEVEDALFVFIWHGDNTAKGEEIKQLASQLAIQGAIRIIGFVDHKQVALYHKASDVMVSVSERDSGPVALQEAMACGDVPIISNLPCVKEWVKDGWNGLLVEPHNVDQIANSIITLLKDQTLRGTFAERNWKLIQENGDQDYWMAKLEEMYYSLLKEKEDKCNRKLL
jgi:glycosyltransferase involved in cell wall biosynthesis